MKEYKAHPAADSFPMMDSKRFEDLLSDIKTNGQRVPIVLYDNQVLDGRNRLKACLELGIEPVIECYNDDPWSYVWSLNGARRDLIAEQRYLIWKHCSENGEAWKREHQQIKDKANKKRSEKAKKQHEVSNPRAGEKVLVEGQTAPAPKKTKHPKRESKAKASKTNTGAVKRGDLLAKQRPDLAEKVRTGEMKPTEAHRQMKKDSVSDRVAEIPEGKFRVIYADPPWSYGDTQSGTISDSYGAAEKHYPCMPLGDICSMPVEERAADDAVLFLWATAPLLPEGLKVLQSWGFKYKAQFIWDKVKHNMGHYNSVRHEHLLIGTKGSCTPEHVKLFDSVQSIERTGKHSEKPEEFREIIETLYPSGEKLELFARKQTQGWKVFGNES